MSTLHFKVFPKNSNLFDNSTSKKIEQAEKYLALWWELQDIKFSIDSFLDIFPNDKFEKKLKEKFKNIQIPNEIIQLAKDYEENKTDFQRKIDDFQDFVSKMGKYGALMFISPKLAFSFEVMFGGMIVSYCKNFNSSKNNIKLCIEDIVNDANLIELHNKIMELRNKYYAHKEWLTSNFSLKYKIENEQIIFENQKREHIKKEFYENFDFHTFYTLVLEIEKFIDIKIEKILNSIKDNLTKEEIEYLSSDYKRLKNEKI